MAEAKVLSREKRVAWLLNHTSLRDAELPMLRKLGVEIYTSKLLLRNATHDFRSQSTNYDDDNFSTLPHTVLSTLNKCRWYEEPINPIASDFLNEYFDTVICSQNPTVLRNVLQNFHGRIVLRAFGFPGTLSYGEYYSRRENRDIFEGIHDVKERFWFAPFYTSVASFETDIFAKKAKVLSIGVPSDVVESAGIWVGSNSRILFVCPSIQTDRYYHGPQYQSFKTHLGELPHTIIGYQETYVPDPNVVGYVSQLKLHEYFTTMRVLFYPSLEKRHIQYHPIEAAIYGMPIIYFKDSLLHELAGGGDLPGSCNDYQEAYVKLKRILNGDQIFIREILASQKQIPSTFLPSNVELNWEKNFINDIFASRIFKPEMTELPNLNWDTPRPLPSTDYSIFVSVKKKISTLIYEVCWIIKRWLTEVYRQKLLIPRDTGIALVLRHNRFLKQIGEHLKFR